MGFDNIQIGEYLFEKYIDKGRIELKILELAERINDFYGSQKVQILVLLEGAETFANHLIPYLKFQYSKTELQLKTYEGLHSTKTIYIPAALCDQINKTEPLLIIEDIIDSGRTLSGLLSFLDEQGVRNKQIVTLLHKPGCVNHPIQPMFIGFEIGPEFVIGFGMDIDGSGRELDCVYKLITN